MDIVGRAWYHTVTNDGVTVNPVLNGPGKRIVELLLDFCKPGIGIGIIATAFLHGCIGVPVVSWKDRYRHIRPGPRTAIAIIHVEGHSHLITQLGHGVALGSGI